MSFIFDEIMHSLERKPTQANSRQKDSGSNPGPAMYLTVTVCVYILVWLFACLQWISDCHCELDYLVTSPYDLVVVETFKFPSSFRFCRDFLCYNRVPFATFPQMQFCLDSSGQLVHISAGVSTGFVSVKKTVIVVESVYSILNDC